MQKILLTLVITFLMGLSLQAQEPAVHLPELEITIDETEIAIDVKVTNFVDLIAVQFTIEWDPTKLQFDSVENFNLPYMNAADFGDTTLNTDAGLLPFIWLNNALQATVVDDSTTIFTIKMTPIGNAGDTAFLKFIEMPASIQFVDVTQYEVPGNVENGQVILLEGPLGSTIEKLKTPNIKLLENYPNPFTDFTNINFELADRTNTTLIITDIIGREIYRKTENRNSGIHNVSIDKTIFPATGEYFYQVQTTEHQLTGKLIFVK